MDNHYQIYQLSDSEYSFDTRYGLSYSIEIKKSNAFYESTEGKIKNLELLSFSIFDKFDAIQSDYKVRNTILQFVLDYFEDNVNDAILFFVNNELDDTHFTHRAKSRFILFRRLFRKLKEIYSPSLIFLTNEHYVLDHRTYKMDYVGIIADADSPDYVGIVRAFNTFCHNNSYQQISGTPKHTP